MKVSVIIPSYMHLEKILNCVNSILNQNFQENIEIIVVDSSDPKTQVELEESLKIDGRISLIKLNQQTFPGTARNIGINKSKGEIIALIDADCIAEENWLINSLKSIEEDSIITGVIKNGTETNIFGTCSYLVEFNNFLEFNESKREIEAAATCNFIAKKSVFEKVGGFSDDRAFEDFLFCHRFKKLGGRIYQLNHISVIHDNKTELSEIITNQKMLGEFSAKARKRTNMPPKILFKYPIFSIFLVGYRYISMCSRIIKSKHIFKFLLFTPIVIYLLFYWSYGFYIGASERKQ